MTADHAEGGACQAITQVFALLGKRWTGLIIVTLLDGPARFSRIVQLVPGMSERMLSERLTELSAAGLITREVEEGPPVNVRYRLTQRGEALRPALAELERWGHEQLLETGKAGADPAAESVGDSAAESVGDSAAESVGDPAESVGALSS